MDVRSQRWATKDLFHCSSLLRRIGTLVILFYPIMSNTSALKKERDAQGTFCVNPPFIFNFIGSSRRIFQCFRLIRHCESWQSSSSSLRCIVEKSPGRQNARTSLQGHKLLVAFIHQSQAWEALSSLEAITWIMTVVDRENICAVAVSWKWKNSRDDRHQESVMMNESEEYSLKVYFLVFITIKTGNKSKLAVLNLNRTSFDIKLKAKQ